MPSAAHNGSGHRGFLVNADPLLPPERAALRRDFTVNAISWDPLDSSIVDPLNGRGDLDAGILRHVGPAFGEDPLRVLRAAQFIARFELDAASETVTMCRTLLHEAATLPRERVAEEWTKLLLQGTRPGSGLHFLDSCGWIERTPGLAALRGVEQDPVWHPEGDVFVHTAHVMDAWARIRPDDREDALVTGLAALCHDLGKPSTTEFIDGRWRARGHESAGTAPTGDLLGLITIRKDLVHQVVPLVENHLAPVVFHRRPRAGRPAIRRLANRVGGRLDRLVTVAHADQAGRPPLVVDTFEAGEWLLAAARDLGIERSTVDPLVQGRDLIELGLRPGRSFGAILAEVYEAQLDDAVADRTEAVSGLPRNTTIRDGSPGVVGSAGCVAESCRGRAHRHLRDGPREPCVRARSSGVGPRSEGGHRRAARVVLRMARRTGADRALGGPCPVRVAEVFSALRRCQPDSDGGVVHRP